MAITLTKKYRLVFKDGKIINDYKKSYNKGSIIFDSDLVPEDIPHIIKEMPLERINGTIVPEGFETFESDSFEEIEKIVNENKLKCL